MTARLLVLALGFATAAAYVGYAMEPEAIPLRRPFALMEDRAGHWRAGPTQPLTGDVLALLGVDDYISRFYHRDGGGIVSLYIGYYQSQREGDTIHSPMNCLPGAGWQPMDTRYVDIPVPGRDKPITVKRVVIEKGLDRQVVLYWYQSHGRVEGSEYWSKTLMVYDALRFSRSDAALVRVVSPVTPDGEDAAHRVAVDFVQSIFPQLEDHLPN